MAQRYQHKLQGGLREFFLFSFSGLIAGSAVPLQASVVTPNGPWQTVAAPVTVTGELITSPTTTDPGDAYWI
jgi:hypothetical protein